jgi:hypothetical protein
MAKLLVRDMDVRQEGANRVPVIADSAPPDMLEVVDSAELLSIGGWQICGQTGLF